LDPQGWISRAEIFFEVQEVAAKDILKLTFIIMEGSATTSSDYGDNRSIINLGKIFLRL